MNYQNNSKYTNYEQSIIINNDKTNIKERICINNSFVSKNDEMVQIEKFQIINGNNSVGRKANYFLTVDVLKGLAILPMIIGHVITWWDFSLAQSFKRANLGIFLTLIFGGMVYPCFLFVYGFNQTNSLLRAKNNKQSNNGRIIKRIIFFLLFGVFAQILAALIIDPTLTLNYIFTMHLFYQFAIASATLSLIWNVARVFSNKFQLELTKTLFTILTGIFFFIISLFIVFHDFTNNQIFIYPVKLNFDSIILSFFLDLSTYGLIPWLEFVIIGALVGLLIHNGNEPLNNKKIIQISSFAIVSLCLGILCLQFDAFTFPAIALPSSYSHFFITIGFLILLFMLLYLPLDYSTRNSKNKEIKILHPILALSKITLTVYFFHSIFAFLNPNLIPNEHILLIIGISYYILFVFIALIWEKWHFKYSLEWWIKKLMG